MHYSGGRGSGVPLSLSRGASTARTWLILAMTDHGPLDGMGRVCQSAMTRLNGTGAEFDGLLRATH